MQFLLTVSTYKRYIFSYLTFLLHILHIKIELTNTIIIIIIIIVITKKKNNNNKEIQYFLTEIADCINRNRIWFLIVFCKSDLNMLRNLSIILINICSNISNVTNCSIF